tara:strand:- start:2221 stop:2469 length:249 start_codon:yes stop_codon:yes gene_type:complete
MKTTIYKGTIERENSSDEFGPVTISLKDIFVKADSLKQAKQNILTAYKANESKYTPNRTSKNFPYDTITVKDITTIENLLEN